MQKQTGSVEMVRKINALLVLNQIREEEPVSRAQISKKLQLSRSTVGQIVDWLLEKKLVFEDGIQTFSVEKNVGRPGQMLRFNPNAFCIVGVSMGRTEMVVCISNLRGVFSARQSFPAVFDANGVAECVHSLCSSERIADESISCVSISVPGIVTKEGKVSARRLKWKNYDLLTELKEKLPYPVYINNDVNLALIGEKTFGIGKECDDIVYLYLGKGIGCGIICNGKMVSGSASTAGEIGLILLNNPADTESTSKPLESLIGSEAFADFPGGFKEMAYGYSIGDDKAARATEQFIQSLCIAITNIIALLNPQMIILGGKTSEYMDDMLEDIRERVEKSISIRTEIRLGIHRTDASLIGAVAFALEHIGEGQES